MKKIFSLMRIKSTYKKGTVFLWFLSVLGTLYFFVHKACCGGFILLFINSFVTWFHVMMNLGGRKKREEYRGIRLVAFLGYFASILSIACSARDKDSASSYIALAIIAVRG